MRQASPIAVRHHAAICFSQRHRAKTPAAAVVLAAITLPLHAADQVSTWDNTTNNWSDPHPLDHRPHRRAIPQ